MKDSRLRKGDRICLLADKPDRVTGKRPEWEVEYAGIASIKVQNHMRTYPWEERGITWTSERLDRLDATKTEFSNAAEGGGKNERTT